MGFKLFFKIVKANFVSFLAYVLILVVSGLMFGLSDSGATNEDFKILAPVYYANITNETVDDLPSDNTLIFDYLMDNNLISEESDDPFSQGFYTYTLNFVNVKKNIKPSEVNDAIYAGVVRGALIIPKDLSTLTRENALFIFHTNSQDLATITPTKAALNKFINTYHDLKEVSATAGNNLSATELTNKTLIALEKETEIVYENPNRTKLSMLSHFFSFSTYIMSAVIILLVSIVMYEIKRREILMRISITPYSIPRLIVGLIFGAITLSLLLVGLVYVLAIISYPKIALSITGLYLTLNIMLFTLPLTALAMVIGLVISKAEIVSIISTVFALAQAFFSGAFLPTFLLPKSIINVGKVFPASHTVTINNLLAEGLNTNGPSILLNIGILLAYFAVFLTIAIILSKKITKREG